MSGKSKANMKPKGKTSAYAYFAQHYREEMKAKGVNLGFGEVSKLCGEKWKELNDAAKKRYQDMADRDKMRYENEMMSYIPPEDGSGGKKRKREKAERDPNAPKRPLSAYFLYAQDHREQVKKEVGNLKPTEIAKEIANRWNHETAAVKHQYDMKAERAKDNYRKEMEKYQAKRAKTQRASQDEDSD